MHPTDEHKEEILAQYGDMQDHGLVDIHAEMTLDFGTVLIALVVAVLVATCAWLWIQGD